MLMVQAVVWERLELEMAERESVFTLCRFELKARYSKIKNKIGNESRIFTFY